MLWQGSDAVHIDSKLKLVDILRFIMNIPLGMNNYQGKKEFVIYAKIKQRMNCISYLNAN